MAIVVCSLCPARDPKRLEHVEGEIPATIPERQISTKSEFTTGACHGGIVSGEGLKKVITASMHRPTRDVARKNCPWKSDLVPFILRRVPSDPGARLDLPDICR